MKYSIFALIIAVNVLISGCSSKNANYLTLDNRNPVIAFADDQNLALKASNALNKDKEVWDNSHLSVLSHDKSLLIVGQTPTLQLKRKVESIVSGLPKVEKIYNQVEVSKPSSLLSRVNDTWITTKIKSKLLTEPELSSYKIRVITENGVVYLAGNPNPENKEKAIDIARSIGGVKKVIDIMN